MCKENLYPKMEKLEVQIHRCTRQGLKVMPCITMIFLIMLQSLCCFRIFKKLGLFLEEGFIRCKGRIDNAEFSYSARFPFLLPKKHFWVLRCHTFRRGNAIIANF